MSESFRDSTEKPLKHQVFMAHHLGGCVLRRAGTPCPVEGKDRISAIVATESSKPVTVINYNTDTYGRMIVSIGSVGNGDLMGGVTVYAREDNPPETFRNPPRTAVQTATIVDDLASALRAIRS